MYGRGANEGGGCDGACSGCSFGRFLFNTFPQRGKYCSGTIHQKSLPREEKGVVEFDIIWNFHVRRGIGFVFGLDMPNDPPVSLSKRAAVTSLVSFNNFTHLTLAVYQFE